MEDGTEIDNLCKYTSQKLVSEMNTENFILTPEMFELVVLAIVGEIEKSELTKELNGEEKREIGKKIILLILQELKNSQKIPEETYTAFISILYYVSFALFTTAKDEWKDHSYAASSSCFFCF